MKRRDGIIGTAKEHVLLALAPVGGLMPVRCLHEIEASVRRTSGGSDRIQSVAIWPCLALGLICGAGGNRYCLTHKGRVVVEGIRGMRAITAALAAPPAKQSRLLEASARSWSRVVDLLMERRG